ncbi:MAG: formate dehydrogenase subunit gamma [Myxococcales bacterium]|nr:formate dehydrogenase subunit gamma [Myxococcales bacterium]
MSEPRVIEGRHGGPRMIERYPSRTRMNHWLVAFLFLCAGLTGLALFHPLFYPFSGLFGGGVWTRILHPFFGILMTLAFFGLFLVMRRDNRLDATDRAWLRASPALLRGDEAGMPPVGKNNAGQKLVFWVAAWMLLILLVTGFFFWSPYFAPAFPILARRIAVVLHAISATILILTIIVHIYAGIWVKGSMQAMTRGTVSEGWARFHHPTWWRQTRGK